jgi:hypothetical protein
MGYREETKFKEEEQDAPEGGHHAPGDATTAPGAMSHAEIYEESKRFWEAF